MNVQYNEQQMLLEKMVDSGSLFITMCTRKNFRMPDFHYHTSYELFYIKSGSATFIIDNKSYHVSDGTLLVIPPYVLHRSIYGEKKETCRIELQVKSSLLNKNMSGILEILSQKVCYTLPLKYQAEILKLFQKMSDEFDSDEKYSEDLSSAYVDELLISVYRHAVSREVSEESDMLLPRKIMEYIAENYHRSITIAELSDVFHVCESTVYKSFKKHIGLKITDYINFTRVMNAERMMRETDLTLMEISCRCGFHDSNYFSSVFKRYKNVTTGRFMRQKRQLR